jgi:hypothetical protein
MSLSNSTGSLLCNAILAAMHPTSGTTTIGTLTITAPIKIRLMTAAGSQTTNGTELGSGGSYVAATGLSIGANWAAPSGASQATNAVISQTNMPVATIPAIELWDSSATPQRMEFGNLTTSKTTASGDTLSFASAAITSAIS